jgi:hypothetical protein
MTPTSTLLPADRISRRRLLAAASGAGAFLALRKALGAVAPDGAGGRPVPPFGAPRPDPNRLVDLPPDFTYRVLSRAGDVMDDGLRVPAAHDGMGAFDGGNGRVVLVCNHELDTGDEEFGAFSADTAAPALARSYDEGDATPCPGGTSTLVYNPASGKVEFRFLSLAGTERNCAGGPTPWGSWLTCEESVTPAGGKRRRDHGWVFEVPAAARERVDPVPLGGLGRFNHEAAAVDAATGIVYLTEDRPDSLFYRFVPSEPGKLQAGGRLQALALPGLRGGDTRNWRSSPRPMPEGSAYDARWIDLRDVHAPDDDLRRRGHAAGAAIFARGEGICNGNDGIYFACTAGGEIGAGQIFRYRPGDGNTGSFELFVESRDRRRLENCDNIVMSPWGDLIACEDAESSNSLVGITPAGAAYHIAENPWTDSEFAGACFAPDGRTLFVNLQWPGLTLAITGPFPAVNAPERT